ncbi:O-antigen ligase family protein [Microbacterium sp. P05]|uniref:O-antigen ligase family protein n=1 Tax=Microbacterium sp. P05 TaxID=3366948 RepID=UPI0037464EA3
MAMATREVRHPQGSRTRQARSLALQLFLALFVLRLFADAKFIPGGLSSALNLAILYGAIAGGFLVSTQRNARTKRITIPVFVAFVVTWFLIGVIEVGFAQPLTSAALRFLALIGMAVLARVAVREIGPSRFAVLLVWGAFPAVLILAVATLTHSPLFFAVSTGRAFGTFNHTNSAASFIAIYILLLAYLLLRQPRWRYALALVVSVVGVVGTLSMGGLIALLSGLILLLLLSGAGVGVKVAALGGVVVSVVAVLASGALSTRLEELQTTVSFDDANSRSITNSLDWRFYNWRRLLDIWEERPIFGIGLGRADFDAQPIGKQPHSEFVRLLVETGLIGSAVIFLLVATAVVLLVRDREVDPWGKALAVSTLATLLVNAIASNTTSYAPTMMLCIATWAVGSNTLKDGPGALPRGKARRAMAQYRSGLLTNG